MQLRTVLIALALVGCTQQVEGPAAPDEAPPVQEEAAPTAPPARPSTKAGGEMLEANPRRYKNNSVMGRVTADGKAVPGSTITVVAQDLTYAAQDDGTYQIVLDPDEIGTNTHELRFSAPGFRDHTQTVTIPKHNRIKVDVTLEK